MKISGKKFQTDTLAKMSQDIFVYFFVSEHSAFFLFQKHLILVAEKKLGYFFNYFRYAYQKNRNVQKCTILIKKNSFQQSQGRCSPL